MTAERDPWPRGWSGHQTQQEEAWAAATPVERLRWLEEMKRFVAAAERARAAGDPSAVASSPQQAPHDLREPGREAREPEP